MYIVSPSSVRSIDILTTSQFNTYNNPDADPSTYKIPIIVSGGDWWLKGAGSFSRYINIVHNNKVNPWNGPCNASLAVRPILNLSPAIPTQEVEPGKGNEVSFANVSWYVVTSSIIISKGALSMEPFRDDWKTPDFADYDKSSLKKFLTDWLNYWKPTS